MYSHLTAASDWPRSFLHPRCFCLALHLHKYTMQWHGQIQAWQDPAPLKSSPINIILIEQSNTLLKQSACAMYDLYPTNILSLAMALL